MTQAIDIRTLIRTVPDFPRPGVQFRDITTLLKRPDGLRAVVEGFMAAYRDVAIDKVAAIESRGFIVGAALAYELRAGFVPIRKGGKLPAENFGQDYELEYGSDRLEMHADAIGSGERVILVDDLIATGGTAQAALRADRHGPRVGCRLRLRHRSSRSRRPRPTRARGPSRAGAVRVRGRLKVHRESACFHSPLSRVQNSISGPRHASPRGRARPSAVSASHQPSHAVRPGRPRQRLRSRLHRA